MSSEGPVAKVNGFPGQERCRNEDCAYVVDEQGFCTNPACDWDEDRKMDKEIIPPCPNQGCAAVMRRRLNVDHELIGWYCAECDQEFTDDLRFTLAPQREMVDHPDHYGGASNPYEAIKVLWNTLTREQFDGWIRGTAYRYIVRAGKKFADKETEDLEKAAWYINWYVTALKGEHDFQKVTLTPEMTS